MRRGPAAKRQQRRGAHRAGRASPRGCDGPPQQQQRRGAARPGAPRRRWRGARPRPGGACGAAGRRGSEEGLHTAVTRGRGGRAGGRDGARGSGGLRVPLGSGQGIGRGPRPLQPRRAAPPPPGSRRVWAREVCGALSLYRLGATCRSCSRRWRRRASPRRAGCTRGAAQLTSVRSRPCARCARGCSQAGNRACSWPTKTRSRRCAPPPPNSVPCVARAQTLCPGRCAAPSASRGRRRSRGCRRRAQAAPRGVGFSVFSFTAVRPGNAIASFELRPDGARPPPRVCKAADRRARRCTCCTRAGARGAGC